MRLATHSVSDLSARHAHLIYRGLLRSGALSADAMSSFLHCLFGPPPYAPRPIPAAYRTTTAVELAQSMYDTRNFTTLPILADALEEAGCEDADVFAHCRADTPHARGCYVVDSLLGRQ